MNQINGILFFFCLDFNFQAISSDVPDSPLEDDITKLLSLSFEEVPKQSTIEDSMGRMNMHQASTGSYKFIEFIL